jgi:hypothetical protein
MHRRALQICVERGSNVSDEWLLEHVVPDVRNSRNVDGHEWDNLDMRAELLRLELLSMPCLVFPMRQWKKLLEA